MIQTLLTKNFIIPLVILLSIVIGSFSIYQYGRVTEKQTEIIKEQTSYVTTRKKIDAAIKDNPTTSSNAALNRLLKRQQSTK